MNIQIDDTRNESGARAAQDGAEFIRKALTQHGVASIILATGASQFDMLGSLVAEVNINWGSVHVFHLDEYAGMPISHPASFRKYLIERFVERLPVPPASFHAINAEGDLQAECMRLGRIIRKHPIDVAFIGIGENGHIAFNDPPADFETDEPYIAVALDEPCRRQQLGEGWFPTLADVPTHAISMSVKQILRSSAIVCTVPDQRKANAVCDAVRGPVTPDVPASILQQHDRTTIYLDRAAAALLTE